MSLTNAQYDSILKEYEQKQNTAHRKAMERLERIYQTIPEYESLDDLISSLASKYTARIIDGDLSARKELSAERKMLTERKKSLLLSAGFPEDYLGQVYECPDCKDTGYIGRERCHCLKRRIVDFLYNQSALKTKLEQENFQTLSYSYFKDADLAAYRQVVESCKSFADEFDREYRNLLFTGTTGTGKSFLTCCIAKELLDSAHSVLYFSAVDFFETLSKNVFQKNKENLYSLLDDLYNCDLVIIDDLGTELSNSFVDSYFFSFINERQLRQKSIVISTNLSLKDLKERYSERIFSRMIDLFEVCVMKGPDIRILRKL